MTHKTSPSFSMHAETRGQQRAINAAHTDFALTWGRPVRRGGGRIEWHVGRRQILAARSAGVAIPDRVENVSVLEARDGTVVTQFRNTSPAREKTPHPRRAARRAGWAPPPPSPKPNPRRSA